MRMASSFTKMLSAESTGNTPARLLESGVAYKRVARLQDIAGTPDYVGRSPRNSLLLVTDDSLSEVAILQPDAIVSESEATALCSCRRWQTHFLCRAP